MVVSVDIRFLPLAEALEFQPTGKYPILISIMDPGNLAVEFEAGWAGILRLSFHDIDGPFGVSGCSPMRTPGRSSPSRTSTSKLNRPLSTAATDNHEAPPLRSLWHT